MAEEIDQQRLSVVAFDGRGMLQPNLDKVDGYLVVILKGVDLMGEDLYAEFCFFNTTDRPILMSTNPYPIYLSSGTRVDSQGLESRFGGGKRHNEKAHIQFVGLTSMKTQGLTVEDLLKSADEKSSYSHMVRIGSVNNGVKKYIVVFKSALMAGFVDDGVFRNTEWAEGWNSIRLDVPVAP